MFKRVRWIGTGVAVGVGGSIWVQHKVKEMAGRYGPANVAVVAANRARGAIEEGRQAMKEREAELRSGRSGSRSHIHTPRPGGRHSRRH